MSIKKQYLKSKPVCKVTFKISAKEADGASKAQVVGSFNGWDTAAGEMNALKNGSFSYSLDLESGKEYQFRYLLDGEKWINEADADAKATNEFNEQNDILSTIN